jgi:hypothetical protein
LESKGQNIDPDKVFTVEDGMIQTTGQELGYIITDDSYSNYHFRLQFKWGDQRWAPRDTLKRDSGICYHIPNHEPDRIWPQSVECQIQEGDVGDFWLIDHSTIVVDAVQNQPAKFSRVSKKIDAERALGEWNTVEVVSFNGQCIHIVNGVVVNAGQHASLRRGRILLQSEFAEIYYRKIEIRKL